MKTRDAILGWASDHDHGARGSSLVELLVAVGLVGIFGLLVHSFTASCLRSLQSQKARSDAQDTAHLATDWIAREVRNAGFHIGALPVTGIAAATSSSLSLRADLNGDGDFDDPHERITYSSDADRATLTRASGAAPPQPVVDHLATNSLRFSYFDGDGSPIDTGPDGLDKGERRAVRRVDVQFAVAIPSRDPYLRDPIRLDTAISIALRNVVSMEPDSSDDEG